MIKQSTHGYLKRHQYSGCWANYPRINCWLKHAPSNIMAEIRAVNRLLTNRDLIKSYFNILETASNILWSVYVYTEMWNYIEVLKININYTGYTILFITTQLKINSVSPVRKLHFYYQAIIVGLSVYFEHGNSKGEERGRSRHKNNR